MVKIFIEFFKKKKEHIYICWRNSNFLREDNLIFVRLTQFAPLIFFL